jgi:hypothetical protein
LFEPQATHTHSPTMIAAIRVGMKLEW